MTTSTVSTSDGLWYAIKGAASSDVVLVEAGRYQGSGPYAPFTFPNVQFAPPGITIQPVPGASVTFSEFEMGGCTGVTIQDIELDLSGSANGQPVQYGVAVGSNTTLRRLKIHRAANTVTDGCGVLAQDGSNITIEDCDFGFLGAAVAAIDCTNIVIQRNVIHDIGNDGLDIAGCTGPQILDNDIHDFFPPDGAHPDAIQFYGSQANPRGSGARIEGNRISRGKGVPIQGPFAASQDDIKVLSNTLDGTMYNGIALGDCTNFEIADNVLTPWQDMTTEIAVRGSTNGTIHDNVTPAVVTDIEGAPNTNVTVLNNRPPSGFNAALTQQLTSISTVLAAKDSVIASLSARIGP